jgi:hypothetical protein
MHSTTSAPVSFLPVVEPLAAGPQALIAWCLALIASAIATASSPASEPIARVLAVRLANGVLGRAWAAFEAFEDDARYSGAAYLVEEVELARNALALAGAELTRLEAALVGSAPLAKTTGRTSNVRSIAPMAPVALVGGAR